MNSMPMPDQAAMAHSEKLQQRIAERMAERALPFAEYMQAALYEPGLGYYVAGARKLGVDGDFVTAPQISHLFSAALANQCADVLAALGPDAALLEYGAGTGRMALDILQRLQALTQLPAVYYIIEPSPDLIARQRETLSAVPELLARVQWLAECPSDFVGLVLANELFDAMPVVVFQYRGGRFYIGDVCARQGQASLVFEREWQSVPEALLHCCQDWPDGYSSEYNPSLPAWFTELYQRMRQGACLFVDYGFTASEYYHPDRSTGTLMCHYRHHAHTDPFFWPGLQDITAHVDFTALAEAADEAGFAVNGYTEQANFLLNCGILDLAQAKDGDERAKLSQSRALQQLMMPQELGELCKVMALSKDLELSWRGFAQLDKRVRLSL